MAPKVYSVQSKGIYHGLPVFDPSIKGLTAIVTGANGISGDYMLRVLGQSPERWSHIYAMSRRPPNVDHGLKVPITHISLDFLNSSPDELAKKMKDQGVKADYVFFFSYIQVEPVEGQGLWSNAEKMASVNKSLLSNFLEGLKIASIKPKRIMLQTGAKNYGIHLGAVKTPQRESDPRVDLEPNFYYDQEDYLWDYCKTNGIEWNICMPSFILGAVREAAMNVCFPIGVFAAVHAYLKKPMVYPGDMAGYMTVQDQSSSMMNAYLEEWAVLTPEAANQKFNATDNSPFTYGRFMEDLAKWYGVGFKVPDDDATKYTEVPQRHKTPPRGFGSNPNGRFNYTLTQWAQEPEVQKAWEEISKKHSLNTSPFKSKADTERIFAFGDGGLTVTAPITMTMDKAKKLGWNGTVDSGESFRSVLEEFVELKMLPPIPN